MDEILFFLLLTGAVILLATTILCAIIPEWREMAWKWLIAFALCAAGCFWWTLRCEDTYWKNVSDEATQVVSATIPAVSVQESESVFPGDQYTFTGSVEPVAREVLVDESYPLMIPNAETQEQTLSPRQANAALSEAFPEQVLVDTAGVRITAKELIRDSFWGPELKLLIENNSGKNLTFQCRNTSVNGYMVDTIMSADVDNGKRVDKELTLMSADLERCGIETIADLETSFCIFENGANWGTDYLNTDPIVIRTEAADSYVYQFDDSGTLAYEQDGIKIVVKGLDLSASYLGPSVIVYIANNSGQDVTIQARNESVNGYMVESIFSCDICTWKYAVDTITFMDSQLRENGITSIRDVELSFHIFTMDGWDTVSDTDLIHIYF